MLLQSWWWKKQSLPSLMPSLQQSRPIIPQQDITNNNVPILPADHLTNLFHVSKVYSAITNELTLTETIFIHKFGRLKSLETTPYTPANPDPANFKLCIFLSKKTRFKVRGSCLRHPHLSLWKKYYESCNGWILMNYIPMESSLIVDSE